MERPEIRVDTGASGIKKVKMNYPSNSHTRSEKKLDKIVKGKVVKRKKSPGKKFLETFFGEDMKNVATYILHDVIIPAAQSTLTDMVKGGIEMLVYGEKQGNRTQRDKGTSYVSYNNYSSNKRINTTRVDRNRTRVIHDFDETVFESRGEAEEVLSCLVDLCIDYGQASVSDFYDLVGITGEFTDNRYGWVDLRGAKVLRARGGGYIVDLPKPIVLD